MQSIKRVLLFFCIVFFNVSILSADHIIAGYANYKHVVDETYNVKFTLIRESSLLTAWSDNISVQIFTNDGSWVFERTVKISLDFVKEIDHGPNQSLADQKGILLEYAEYSWNYELIKPDVSYLFVYQSCCRAFDIANIREPNQTGLTLSTSIGSQARIVKNSSITFDILPNFFAEVNKEITSYNPVRSYDSDSLSFNFKSVFLGGGLEGGNNIGDPESCDGITPLGPCYPPYDQAKFSFNGGQFNQPFEAWDNQGLDQRTGKLLGIPRASGKFSYGMVVYEFRNGVLMNSTNLDYIVYAVLNTSTSDVFNQIEQPHLYPNPTTGIINLELNNPLAYQYQLYALDGTLLSDQPDFLNGKIQFNIHNNPGMYIVKCFNDKLASSFKVVVLD